MADNVPKQTPREFLSDFIELYQIIPCLWLIKSKEYFDRNKKDLAYIELIINNQEYDPSVDRNTIVKKTNAFQGDGWGWGACATAGDDTI